MKIAIVGTTGMLGYAMSKYLRAHQVIDFWNIILLKAVAWKR